MQAAPSSLQHRGHPLHDTGSFYLDIRVLRRDNESNIVSRCFDKYVKVEEDNDVHVIRYPLTAATVFLLSEMLLPCGTMNTTGRFFRRPHDPRVSSHAQNRNGKLLHGPRRALPGAFGRFHSQSRTLRLDQVSIRRRAELDFVDYRDLNGIHARENTGHLSNGAVDSSFEELDKDIQELESAKPPSGLWQKLSGVRSLASYLANPKELGRRGEGLFLTIVLSAALAFFPPFFLKGVFGVMGYLALTYGAISAIAGIVALGSSYSPLPVPRPDAQFVTRGIFRLVRHPFYSGIVAMALGVSLITGNEFRLFMTVLLYWILDETIKGEERDLEAAYPEYASYKSRVSKWIPYVG